MGESGAVVPPPFIGGEAALALLLVLPIVCCCCFKPRGTGRCKPSPMAGKGSSVATAMPGPSFVKGMAGKGEPNTLFLETRGFCLPPLPPPPGEPCALDGLSLIFLLCSGGPTTPLFRTPGIVLRVFDGLLDSACGQRLGDVQAEYLCVRRAAARRTCV